jgi:signal transduction histidine kinase
MERVEKILLIEDDEDDAFIIEERFLSFIGPHCQIEVVNQYDEAVSSLISNQYDICLLDYYLGAYKGVDILKDISQYDITTPIIVMTGLSDEDKAKEAIQLGAQDYLAKSAVDSFVFEKSIDYAISRKALEIYRIKNRQIESENIAKNKFISHLSHELRTPLTSILGYTSLLLENPLTEPVKKELNIISSNGKHLLNLLNDALDMSKMLAGKFDLYSQNCDLRLLLCEVYSIIQIAAENKKLKLAFDAVGDLPSHIKIDETRLKQVLLNLLSNAIKFTDTGDVALTVEKTTHAGVPHLLFAVKDSGIGIDQNKLNAIFQPFTQLEDVSIRRSGGAGLGLAICTEIIQRMQGRIEVDSEKHKGTCFNIAIPLVEGERCEYKPIQMNIDLRSTQKTQHIALQGKVLVVDDVQEIHELVGQLLSSMGLEVLFAKSAYEALDHMANDVFKLVFMDLQMPGMTGQECVSTLRAKECRVPIIAMTAGNTHSIKNELMSEGFDGLLIKPIDADVLRKVCSRFLNDHNANNSVVKKQFLLIEDDEDSANIMTLLLKRLNYSVEIAGDLEQAIAKLTELNDGECTILTDLNLGNIGPREVLKAIRSQHMQSALYVVSGMQPDLGLITEYDVKEYLLKPIDFSLLKHHFASVY